MNRAGLFVVLDGPDYGGKSTQACLLCDSLRRRGRRVLHVRDPGGTPISEAIRGVLLDPANRSMAMTTETLLYTAARAQLVAEVIRPALARGTTVVCERFVLSTAVYQGLAGRVGVRPVFDLAQFAVGGVTPDVTVVLDIDPAAGARRHRGPKDRIERRGLAFQRKVRAGFLRLARRRRGVIVVDAGGTVEAVAMRVLSAVVARLGLKVV